MVKKSPNKNYANDMNMFTYLYNLRLFNKELSDINTTIDLEIFLAKIMAYIYSNKTLLIMFQEELKVISTTNFENEYYDEYKKIQEINKEIAQKENNRIEYTDIKQVKSYVKYYVNNKLKADSFSDIPIIYAYFSIGLPSYNFLENKVIKTFEMSKDLKRMYFYYCKKYNIKICKNIEFYIVWEFAKRQLSKNFQEQYLISNFISYLKTSINYVLNTLMQKCNNVIRDEYIVAKGLKVFSELEEQIASNRKLKKQHFLTIHSNENFYLDKQLFELSDTHKETLKKILDIDDGDIFVYKNLPIEDKNLIKTHVSRINSLAKNLIYQNLLGFSKKEETYKCLPNVQFKQLDNKIS